MNQDLSILQLVSRPGRIEAIVLAAAASPGGAAAARSTDGSPDAATLRPRIDAAVKAANGRLGPNQRIHGWRLWPDEDFPRTHTLKIKRGPVRDWAIADTPPASTPEPAAASE